MYANSGLNPSLSLPLVAANYQELSCGQVSVRAQFFSGMLAYVVATALRVYRELHKSTFLAKATLFFFMFATLEMLSFFNSHLVFYSGFWNLLCRYFVLAFQRAVPWIYDPTAAFRLGPVLAILCLAISCGYFICAALDIDGDGSLSKRDLATVWQQIRGGQQAEDRPIAGPVQ